MQGMNNMKYWMGLTSALVYCVTLNMGHTEDGNADVHLFSTCSVHATLFYV